jgi:hemoglobin-like flavoprotein
MTTLDTPTIDCVRTSWELVAPNEREVAALFYRHLLTLDPSLKPMFGGDMAVQGERLMSMIGAALNLLDRPAQLLPVLRSLGARHSGYGVTDAHYPVVAQALLQTLQDGLADAFTDDVRAAWATVYGVLATEMQAGAATASAGVPARQMAAAS